MSNVSRVSCAGDGEAACRERRTQGSGLRVSAAVQGDVTLHAPCVAYSSTMQSLCLCGVSVPVGPGACADGDRDAVDLVSISYSRLPCVAWVRKRNARSFQKYYALGCQHVRKLPFSRFPPCHICQRAYIISSVVILRTVIGIVAFLQAAQSIEAVPSMKQRRARPV